MLSVVALVRFDWGDDTLLGGSGSERGYSGGGGGNRGESGGVGDMAGGAGNHEIELRPQLGSTTSSALSRVIAKAESETRPSVQADDSHRITSWELRLSRSITMTEIRVTFSGCSMPCALVNM